MFRSCAGERTGIRNNDGLVTGETSRCPWRTRRRDEWRRATVERASSNAGSPARHLEPHNKGRVQLGRRAHLPVARETKPQQTAPGNKGGRSQSPLYLKTAKKSKERKADELPPCLEPRETGGAPENKEWKWFGQYLPRGRTVDMRNKLFRPKSFVSRRGTADVVPRELLIACGFHPF